MYFLALAAEMKFELQALTIGITSILKILQGTQSLIEEFHSFSG